ncbi:hypothetical protein [Roseateles sp. BYS87W]|uniref:PEP-CTERM sorting domain-containing protein n=1 Tax=Pelomonas baiyunensis TaxID=3299026 RepID=A0ABW7H1X1_9BURK
MKMQLWIRAALLAAALPAHAKFVNQPTPVVSPAAPATATWEFGGYGNYGRDGSSSILYEREQHTWTLNLPATMAPGSYLLSVWLAADDTYSRPESSYLTSIQINGNTPLVINGLAHGTPFGTRFTNWTQVNLPVSTLGASFDLTIANGKTSANWIAIDKVQVSAVPEPGAVTLWALGGLALLPALRRRPPR